MDIPRVLDLSGLLAQKSFFLFGPRGTGKTSLIRQTLRPQAVVIDLLKSRLHRELAAMPEQLEGIIDAERAKTPGSLSQWVVLDEIQKVPQLLDEVHRLIEERKFRFLLTGSSARKLRRGAANLLAGRAWEARLFPLTHGELGAEFRLEQYLQTGGLPAVYLSSQPREELDAYVNTYLQEEVLAEGLIRNLGNFSRFLTTMALAHGHIVNYAQLASDAAVSASTIREYVSVLEDTLVGFSLEPWTGSKKRKAIQTAKFFFFDVGVRNSIVNETSIPRNSPSFGTAFESFIGMELRAYLSYRRVGVPLTYWRSVNRQEVDFVAGDLAVEVKAAGRVSERDLKGLLALAEERQHRHFVLVSQDPIARHVTVAGTRFEFLPWTDFLQKLWANGYVSR